MYTDGITQEQLKIHIKYIDGCLFWYNHPSKKHFNGKRIGHKRNDGYCFSNILGLRESIHRLVWLYFKGYIPPYPEKEIDHIDRDRSNNRIENLRVVDKSKNQINTGVRVNNSLGCKNIYKRKCGSFRVGMTIDRKFKWFGSFSTIEEAIKIRDSIYEKHGRK